MSDVTTFLIGALLGAGAFGGGTWWLRSRQKNLADELRRFFGTDPATLPVSSRPFGTVDLPNLQLAVERFVAETGGRMRVTGYNGGIVASMRNDLGSLVSASGILETVRVSAPSYRQVDVGLDRQLRCLGNGIFLIEARGTKYAVHIRSNEHRPNDLHLEVMTSSEEEGGKLLETIRSLAVQQNVYRGKVISLECGSGLPWERGHAGVRFHQVPPVSAEELILPDETFRLLERNTAGFFRHAEQLRKSGRSVKRGLLLHGKPGTGKTYTARWLSQALPGVTTILMSGEQLWLIKECCRLARMLAPALVVMEDVDLVAAERNDQRHPLQQVTLHTLLNEMDGISSTAEILFLLTTNRPEVIEPAIAARPGRIDQAILFPLPDAACRARLLQLYSRGLTLELQEPERIIEKTEGASPAFIQELLRKAALLAAEAGSTAGDTLRVTDAHLEHALSELVFGGGELTRQLLGFPETPVA